mmetsp:Transcript_4722/g.10630  ORF Transcript_4722/g.10630 Transcript_4722/m.10630 type:complete len:203 (-) Transcript_4722:383-991(-)
MWSAPRACCCSLSALLSSTVASSRRPLVCSREARFFIVVSVEGCAAPRERSLAASTCAHRRSASCTPPWAPHCSARLPRMDRVVAWSGPKCFSYPARATLYSASAAPCAPSSACTAAICSCRLQSSVNVRSSASCGLYISMLRGWREQPRLEQSISRQPRVLCFSTLSAMRASFTFPILFSTCWTAVRYSHRLRASVMRPLA